MNKLSNTNYSQKENNTQKDFNKSKSLGYNNTNEQFYQTGSSPSNQGQNPASLKGKLQNIEEMVKQVSDELSLHKKELQILKSEKDTLEKVLGMKTDDVKKTLTNELNRLEDEMKRYYVHQQAENQRVQTMLNTLKQEKTGIQQTLISLQRRISELEIQIGNYEQ